MAPLPGGPDALLAAADTLQAAGRRLQEARDAVAAHGHSVAADWTGLAAPLAQARLEEDAAAAQRAADACLRAGPPLRTYAEELRLAQRDFAEGERMATAGQLAVDPVGSGAVPAADAAREQAVLTATDGANIMTAAEDRARVANEAAAREMDAATALLAGIAPPRAPGPVVGRDGTLGDGLVKAAGDVGTEVASLVGGAVAHANVFSDDFLPTWKNTWDTTTAAVTHPVEAVRTVVTGTVAPLGDSYRSGGIDEALGRAPGVLAGVVGGKGLTKLGKLNKLDDLEPGEHTPVAPGGGLQRHENAGGHTLSPERAHVGASDQDLLDRQARQSRSSPVSTFYDRATAERAVQENLAGNRRAIDDWLRSPRNEPARLEWDHPQPTGRSAPRRATIDQIIDTSRTRVVLVKDATMPEGYRILTAFPDP